MANWQQILSEDSHAGRMAGGRRCWSVEVRGGVWARQFVWESIWYDRRQDPGKEELVGGCLKKIKQKITSVATIITSK